MSGFKAVLKAKPSITSKLTMPPHKPTRSTHSSSSRQIIFIYIFTTRTDLHFWSAFYLYSQFYIQLVYEQHLRNRQIISFTCYDCIPNQTMSTTKPTQTDLNFGLFSVCGWKFGIRKDQTKMEPSLKTAMDLILHNLFQFSLISIRFSLNFSTTQSKQFTSMFLYWCRKLMDRNHFPLLSFS
jgi:hypothetical protein